MGNCTGYCTSCKEEQRYDNSQVRNSIKEKDIILNEDFVHRYSQNEINPQNLQYGMTNTNNITNGNPQRQLRRMDNNEQYRSQ